MEESKFLQKNLSLDILTGSTTCMIGVSRANSGGDIEYQFGMDQMAKWKLLDRKNKLRLAGYKMRMF